MYDWSRDVTDFSATAMLREPVECGVSKRKLGASLREGRVFHQLIPPRRFVDCAWSRPCWKNR